MRYRIATAMAVFAFAAPAAAQQGQGTLAPARRAAVEMELQEERARVGVESRIVTGAPYSAEAVTETSQTLADGNRIARKSVTRIHRDSEGRTRRETVGANGEVSTVVISDPVAESQWVLIPAQRLAHRNGVIMATGGGFAVASVRPGGSGTVAATRTPEGGVAVEAREARADSEEMKRRREVEVAAAGAAAAGAGSGTAAAGSGVAAGGGGSTTSYRAIAPVEAPPSLARVPGNSTVNKEDLGQQVVEGVMARGTRTTTTIPAGEVGNVQPIEIVSEQWFSDDLKVLVMTRHADPRTGETTYKLTNVSLADPARTLFEVPADYTVRDSVIRRKPLPEQPR